MGKTEQKLIKINMKSSANLVKGQGVGACYQEQVALMKNCNGFEITENGYGNYDIIHYHTVNPGFYLNRLLKRNKSIGVGYVHFLPNTLDDSLRLPKLFRAIFYKYLLSFYNKMDFLVTVNPYFIKEIRKYEITRPKVLSIPNFVDEAAFHPIPKESIEYGKVKYQIDLEKFVVLGVGQLQTRKGIMDFIETARELPNIQFVWAGGFSFGKLTKGYDDIKEIVNNSPDNVLFLGIVEREEMNLIYNLSDVFFLPSYDELFPMSILEALSCKKPTLVRNIPLYNDILFDYCLRGSSVEEFVERISSISNSKEEYLEWVDKAWECHCLYTKEQAATLWTDFYRNAYNKATIGKEIG